MIYHIWIIASVLLIAWSCSVLGSFLLVRKMSMMSDAISHAVLPGIVIAYLVSGNKHSNTMLIGAMVFGLLTTLLIEWFIHKGKIQKDAAIGMVFTFLFAVGIILLTAYGGNIDLDADCVLYGDVLFIPFQPWFVGGMNLGPEKLWIFSGIFLIVSVFVRFAFRAWVLQSFDASFAKSLGLSAFAWHLLLMSLVSALTVVSFEAVGAIMVVGFTSLPAATAFLISKRMKNMLFYALVFASLGVCMGYVLAFYFNASVSGAICLCMGVNFVLIFSMKLLQAKKIKQTFVKNNL